MFRPVDRTCVFVFITSFGGFRDRNHRTIIYSNNNNNSAYAGDPSTHDILQVDVRDPRVSSKSRASLFSTRIFS